MAQNSAAYIMICVILTLFGSALLFGTLREVMQNYLYDIGLSAGIPQWWMDTILSFFSWSLVIVVIAVSIWALVNVRRNEP